MHWQLALAVLLLAWQGSAAARTTLDVAEYWPEELELRSNDNLEQNNYPSYIIQRKQSKQHLEAKAASPKTTTARPLVRVWNNFVRNVQPNFNFRNLTNPLANLFNEGNANIIETTPHQLMSMMPQLMQQQPQKPKKTKRKQKRRKQQLKQAPIYNDYVDPTPFGYYAPAAGYPLPLLGGEQLYYADSQLPIMYNNMPHLREYNPASIYGQFMQQKQSGTKQKPLYLYDANRKQQNVKALPVLRPLIIAQIDLSHAKRPVAVNAVDYEDEESSAQTAEIAAPAVQAEAAAIVNEVLATSTEAAAIASSTTEAVDVAIVDDVDADEEDEKDERRQLSQSMRNQLSSYMRDDQLNRQRQQNEMQAFVAALPKLGAPRQQFYITERLFNQQP